MKSVKAFNKWRKANDEHRAWAYFIIRKQFTIRYRSFWWAFRWRIQLEVILQFRFFCSAKIIFKALRINIIVEPEQFYFFPFWKWKSVFCVLSFELAMYIKKTGISIFPIPIQATYKPCSSFLVRAHIRANQ